MLVAALYVDPTGPYASWPGVVPVAWPEHDARLYDGPWPVVAHPPCERWGRYARLHGHTIGDDGGCFSAALCDVRRWGGVLEHPAGSHGWRWGGIVPPRRGGGWYAAGDGLGWTCCVDQGWYGHPAPKPTWLYAVGCELPSLRWGRSSKRGRVENLSARQRRITPEPFAEILVAMARSVRP